MKLDMGKVKIITHEMFNNRFNSVFGNVDVQELHKNKEERSRLLTEVELIPLLMSIPGV